MANTTIYNLDSLKDKKRSKRIAIGVHAILLVFLAIPFANQIKEATAQYAEVTVDFRDFKAASAMSAAAAGEEKTTEEEVTKPEIKPEPVKAKTPEVKNPVKSTVIEKKPSPVKATTKPKVKTSSTKATPRPKPTKVKAKVPVKTTGNKGSGKVATQGTGKKGNASTDGKADAGKQGMDFEGNALFARRVIKRAEIKHLSKKEGVMVVNLCVNQDGGVVYTEFNKKDSNIYDKAIVTEAIKATKKYRFEPDYTAPKKQCGKLTYIIELN